MKVGVLVLTLLSLLLLEGCGDDSVAGNSGTSTDNALQARTLAVDSLTRGQPAGEAPVLLRLDSSHLDFSLVRPDGSNLRIERTDHVPLPFVLREWDRQARHGSLWVRLTGLGRGPGDSLVVRSHRDSTFSRSSAPAVWNGIPDSLRERLTSVRLSDFSAGSNATPLPCQCNSWYAVAAPGATLSSLVSGGSAQPGLVEAGAGRPGKALLLQYTAPEGSWVLAGSRLGTSPHALGALDSITFHARGDGRIQIALEDGRDSTGMSKAWKTFALDSTWRRFTVRPADFDPPDALLTLGWAAVKGRINTVTVFGKDGTQLWVDDIRLHGISPIELP